MELLELSHLGQNPYPGRGILMGLDQDGLCGVMAYFIMGRSPNSKNRVFVPRGAGIATQAADSARVTDPSLILYTPVDKVGDTTIVTNGDQTDTIRAALGRGGTFEEALRTRTFEPDAPNYTPRISGVMTAEGGALSYKLSILKSGGGDPRSAERFFWEYPQPLAGQGRLLHTYLGDGSPALPSFEGEPRAVALRGGLDDIAAALWESLSEDNRVSLFVRTVRLGDGREDTRIINRYRQKEEAPSWQANWN